MDNAAHQHLLVNHFPIIGAALALPLLVLTLVLRKERGLLLASVFLLVVTAATGWMSERTGEAAQTYFENNEEKKWYAPYEEADVALHEERAERATWWFAMPTAAFGLALLVVAHTRPPEKPVSRWWIALLLVGSGLTAAGMGYAGNAGGVIVHREIRGDSLDTTVKAPDDGK